MGFISPPPANMKLLYPYKKWELVTWTVSFSISVRLDRMHFPGAKNAGSFSTRYQLPANCKRGHGRLALGHSGGGGLPERASPPLGWSWPGPPGSCRDPSRRSEQRPGGAAAGGRARPTWLEEASKQLWKRGAALGRLHSHIPYVYHKKKAYFM